MTHDDQPTIEPTSSEPSRDVAADQPPPETAKKPAKRTRKAAAPRSTAEPAAEAEPADAAPKAKTPRRTTKKATAAAQQPAAETGLTQLPAGETPAAVQQPPADEAAHPVAATKRTTKRAVKKIAALELSHEPAVLAQPEPPAAPAMAAPAPLALFMAPEEVPAAARPATKRRRATSDPDRSAAGESTDVAPQSTTGADDAQQSTAETDAPQSTDSDDSDSSSRRRRGRRGRSKSTSAQDADESTSNDTDDKSTERKSTDRKSSERKPKAAAPNDDADHDSGDKSKDQSAGNNRSGASRDQDGASSTDEDDEGTGTRRRRRRRRRDDDTAEDSDNDDSSNTRASDASKVRGVSGSVRLEAKRQRRKEGRDAGRRRAPILTEAEFLARRESVTRTMLVRQLGDRTQIAVLEDGVLAEHYVTLASEQSFAGGIYLGRVQNVLPSMEAAFIDIGKKRNAVLYAGEVNWEAAGLEGKARNIERALKSGDKVLVQVTKDPIGHKGARLSSQISLPGRFLVYVPGSSMTGISRKLPEGERRRLKDILRKIVPDDVGVIVRTAAEGASEDELTLDVERLQAQWDGIEKKVGESNTKAPSALYEEPDLAIRVVRDLFNEDFESMVVAGDEAWETISTYIGQVAPDLAGRLSKYTGTGEIFHDSRIDEQLAKALDRKVFLPSGGSLVIDNTEAMTVIDVNTGKFTGTGGNLEQTVTKNNLEAAEEIVRQLRLRDVGGIVVIDFIDMLLESNRDLVLRRLTECLGRDRTKHQVAEVTSLGLIQMTRKRVGQGLLDAFSEPCPHCNGRGIKVFGEPVDKSDSSSDSDSGANDRSRNRRGRGRGDNRPDGRSDKDQSNGPPAAEDKKADPPKDSSDKISQIANSMRKLGDAVAEQVAAEHVAAESSAAADESTAPQVNAPPQVSAPENSQQDSADGAAATIESAAPSRPAPRRRRAARRPAGSPQHTEVGGQ